MLSDLWGLFTSFGTTRGASGAHRLWATELQQEADKALEERKDVVEPPTPVTLKKKIKRAVKRLVQRDDESEEIAPERPIPVYYQPPVVLPVAQVLNELHQNVQDDVDSVRQKVVVGSRRRRSRRDEEVLFLLVP